MEKIMNFFEVDLFNWFLSTGIYLLIIFAAVLLFYFLTRWATRILERRWLGDMKDPQHNKRFRTVLRVIRSVILIFWLIVATIAVFEVLGIDTTGFLAGAGVAGIIIGIGAQGFIKDLISGMTIILQDAFNVGDVVEIGGKAGLVEYMSLRITRLRDLEGRVHYINNGIVDVITNYTKEWSACLLDVGVAYKEHPEQVIQALKEIDEAFRQDPYYGPFILEPLEIFGVEKLGNSSVDIRIRYKTMPLKQWEIVREFRKRIKIEFDKRNIEIPFPHQTLYIGSDKKSQGILNSLNVVKQYHPQQ